MFFTLLAVGGFMVAGYFDLKERKIPDVVIGPLWGLAMLPISPNYTVIEQAALMGASFPWFYFLNSVAMAARGKCPFGWGDMLLFPPYLTFVVVLGQPGLGMMIGLPVVVSALLKEKQPVAPWLAFGALVAVKLASLA